MYLVPDFQGNIFTWGLAGKQFSLEQLPHVHWVGGCWLRTAHIILWQARPSCLAWDH